MMEHKGYIAEIEFDDAAAIFHGRVINTRDVITFEGTSVDDLREAFADSVEDYLAFCEKLGRSPEKPFKGRFQVRLTSELHRRIHIAAATEGVSMNEYVVKALDEASAASTEAVTQSLIGP